MRQAEAVSVQRAQRFNKPKAERFYAMLKTMLFSDDGQQTIPPCSIYTVDESGFTICQKPGRIVASKGKHNGILTSTEKGKNVMAVCCASATGDYVPPLLVFPRAKLRPSLMDPPGSVDAANKIDWM